MHSKQIDKTTGYCLAACLLILSACSITPDTLTEQQRRAVVAEEDLIAIHNLQSQYFDWVDRLENQTPDKPDPQAVIETLFTPGSVWTLELPGRDNIRFQGAEGLEAFVAWLEDLYRQGVHFKHLSANPQVELAANSASSTEQLLILRQGECDGVTLSHGEYRNTFSKTPEGKWRYQTITLRFSHHMPWLTTATHQEHCDE